MVVLSELGYWVLKYYSSVVGCQCLGFLCIMSLNYIYKEHILFVLVYNLSFFSILCCMQFICQENLCKPNALQRTQHASDVVSLLSEIRICTGKNDCWSGIRTANIPAVMDSAAAASGAKNEDSEGFILEVLSTAIVSATVKCNHAGEIAGMRRLYNSIGGLQMGSPLSLGLGPQSLKARVPSSQSHLEKESFNELLLLKFVEVLQQFVGTAEKGESVDKTSFRETCSQATALLLSHMVYLLCFFLKLAFLITILFHQKKFSPLFSHL